MDHQIETLLTGLGLVPEIKISPAETIHAVLLAPVTLAICLGAFIAVGIHMRHASARAALKYFTVLSNLLCGVTALVFVIFWLQNPSDQPAAVILLRYAGTAAVAVTLLTVLFFLGPSLGYGPMLAGPDLWLHLICPALALAAWFIWNSGPLPFASVLAGWAPVALYACLYLYKVICARPEKRWKDFYGFNKGGRWPLSCVIMLAGSFLVSLMMWLPFR